MSPYLNLRTSHLASSEFNSKDRPDGTSGPGTLALAGVPLAETVERSQEKDQDEERGRRRLTIHVLPDDVLICLFDSYREVSMSCRRGPWPWRTLVHVCQRWRHIIFTWPLRLGVQLDCNAAKTDVEKLLEVWPPLPISLKSRLSSDGDGIITKLQYRDRIVGIDLANLTGIQLERCAVFMQAPFPYLRSLCLSLHPDANRSPALTEEFFAGSAPRLRELTLMNVEFPTLPKLLLSSRDLVTLYLGDMTSTEHISPDAIATCLSTLTRLQNLRIEFPSQGSFSNPRSPSCPPLTRAVLPSLSHVKFQGVSEYSEDLMSRIDAPLLDCLCLVFFDQPIIDTPELLQFMHRSKIFKPPSKVEVTFRSHVLRILLPSDSGYFYMGFQCIGLYRQLSLLNHIFTQPECLPLLSHVYQLDLSNFRFDDDSQLDQQDPMPRLEFLRSFNTVQILNVDGTSMQSEYFLVVHIARVLGGLTSERAAEVLPMMHTLLLKGFDRVGHLVTPLLKPFIDERQLSGQPVVVRWTG